MENLEEEPRLTAYDYNQNERWNKMRTYQINFKYVDSGSSSRKLIRASSEEEAINQFHILYKDFKVEIKKIIDKGLNYKE